MFWSNIRTIQESMQILKSLWNTWSKDFFNRTIELLRYKYSNNTMHDRTLSVDIFLQFDGGADDDEKILIFCSETDSQHLTRSRTIFVDG